MPLSHDDVAHVALLARLGLSAEERAALTPQLDAILDHIRQLETVDVSGVAETAQVGGLVNVWREDEDRPPFPAHVFLEEAPDAEGTEFRVGAIQE